LRLITYNVAGLPALLSSSEPEINTPMIGPLLSDFDVVHVQEDFNYHAALYANDVHPFRSETSGGVPFGDGLNTLSNFAFFELARTKWSACNGTDCLTPKGFSYTRLRLSEGVYLDLYNAHPNASVEEPDLAARRANISQLVAYIETHSVGNAVLVMGDTNTRYTRAGDNVREFTEHGFSDPWLELVRKGDVPVQGADALTQCTPTYNTKDCEIVDKIFYRSNRMLRLKARSYKVEDTRFVRPDGVQLSDHYPVTVDLDYTLASGLRASDLVGGAGGEPFNDLSALTERPSIASISVRGAERVDGLSVSYADNSTLVHGGTGGVQAVLELEAGDLLRRAELCTGDRDGAISIFYAAFETDGGKRVEAGTRSADCVTFEAPPSFAITGFYGRAGSEIDRLGLLYTLEP
jgi:endonuclease/exonuclease/phosphatase family metal-dependent hydrolase